MQDSTVPGTAPAEARFLAARGPTILQVLPALQTGGVERGTCDMAAALMEAGWRAMVASAGGPMVREIERAGAVHVVLPLDTKNPVRIWRNGARLADLVRAWKVDLIHARSRAPAWSAFLASQRTGVPLVTTFHGTYNNQNDLKRRYNSIMTRGVRVIAIWISSPSMSGASMAVPTTVSGSSRAASISAASIRRPSSTTGSSSSLGNGGSPMVYRS